MKFTIFTICIISLHFSNVEYIHFVGQPISRTFSFGKNWNSISIKKKTKQFPISPFPADPGNHPSTFSFHEFGHSRYLIYGASYSVCLFVFSLSHLA